MVVPPVKCQGIKTKLIGFILSSIRWEGKGRWVEPFLGSGVVLFNVKPERAKVSDSNPHIARLYQRIYAGEITADMAFDHLSREGERLSVKGESYYYEVRNRFNIYGDTLDFLFLNRSCFNGVMRFNKKGEFNVPFCRKPDRFRQAYVTKIANQISTIGKIMHGRDWQFIAGDWRDTLRELYPDDFVYLDPPYIGRHTDYYNQWSDRDAIELSEIARQLPCGVALSMWKQNRYRSNAHLAEYWGWAVERTHDHFYHVGSTEALRNSMEEALMIKPGYEAGVQMAGMQEKQLLLFDV